MNLLDGIAKKGFIEIGKTRYPIPSKIKKEIKEGQEVVFGVRPEYATISRSAGKSGFVGKVKVTENLGTHYLVTIDSQGLLVRGTVTDGSEPKIGTTVTLKAEPARVLIYDKKTGDLI